MVYDHQKVDLKCLKKCLVCEYNVSAYTFTTTTTTTTNKVKLMMALLKKNHCIERITLSEWSITRKATQ